MSVRDMFKTKKVSSAPPTNTFNKAGGRAYALSDRAALAQFASTGTLGGTFYASADDQLETVLKLAKKVDTTFLLQTALWSRNRAFMKDIPSLLLAIVATRGDEQAAFKATFPKVINNGKMLRNFVTIIRSGQLGRKSFGSSIKKLIQNYLATRTDDQLFNDSVGNDPPLADIIKMVHPHPANATREALYAYLIGKDLKGAAAKALPQLVKDYEKFKKGDRSEIPPVDFRMLTSATLSTSDWEQIALNLPWHALRMNLNTLARNKVFNDPEVTQRVSIKLRNVDDIVKSKVFPYQLMAAYRASTGQVPPTISNALQHAMETAIGNLPEFPGKVWVFVDLSGSMSALVTGAKQSTVSCRDVAALLASSVLRRNPNAEVVGFGTAAQRIPLNPMDSVMTNAEKLSRINLGGTDCSTPLRLLNQTKAKGDLIIYASDNESWLDSQTGGTYYHQGGGKTGTMAEWEKFKKSNPSAKLVCVDLAANRTSQAMESRDILNVGGFSDSVYDVISAFAQGGLDANHWVGMIEGIGL